MNRIRQLVTAVKVQIKLLLDPRSKWEKYYRHTKDWTFVPEPFLYDLKIPGSVNTFLDIGCASGRNFIPFNGKLKLWGIDIVPEDRITWVEQFQNLTYQQLSVEQFTRNLERGGIDLASTLVFTGGTLMYVSEKDQRRFFKACRMAGCDNFIFSEYPSDSALSPVLNFKLPPEWFEVKKYIKGLSLFMNMGARHKASGLNNLWQKQ